MEKNISGEKLHKILGESFKHEANAFSYNDEPGEVFAISAEDVYADTPIVNNKYCLKLYHSSTEAIHDAFEFAKSMVNDKTIILVTVYGDAFQDEDGSITGEPHPIFTVSSSSEDKTNAALENYAKPDLIVDAFVG